MSLVDYSDSDGEGKGNAAPEPPRKMALPPPKSAPAAAAAPEAPSIGSLATAMPGSKPGARLIKISRPLVTDSDDEDERPVEPPTKKAAPHAGAGLTSFLPKPVNAVEERKALPKVANKNLISTKKITPKSVSGHLLPPQLMKTASSATPHTPQPGEDEDYDPSVPIYRPSGSAPTEGFFGLGGVQATHYSAEEEETPAAYDYGQGQGYNEGYYAEHVPAEPEAPQDDAYAMLPVGERRRSERTEGVEFKQISQSKLTEGAVREAKVTPGLMPTKKKPAAQPMARVAKTRHQITWLAAEAAEKGDMYEAQRNASARTKSETWGKYGW